MILITKYFRVSFALIIVLLIQSCSSSKSNYKKEYAKVWKELIKTEAWKQALVSTKDNANSNELYASSEDVLVLSTPGSFKTIQSPWFKDKYASLVSRAYFKIISEAQKADARLEEDYEYWTAKEAASTEKDKTLKKRVGLVIKKYEAHKNMLSGLKSWNIFSEDRSGDLDYFKAENDEAIHKMYLQGLEEKAMVNYLVFKLADLYHFEE
ncbi:hypothetical protein CLV91_0956 [Maribacter vaceletii]|uniref:Uncharacterized protein n=1 Tax=Maribacter vaceletii TaxID=1206816 RepID=A0A495EDB8_9FLAO|nr:hypothetical protein [Maribacter vaceletii]RKR14875.1 hypothetical protein CLV91_0956 [Maribacter vaceletii]